MTDKELYLVVLLSFASRFTCLGTGLRLALTDGGAGHMKQDTGDTLLLEENQWTANNSLG